LKALEHTDIELVFNENVYLKIVEAYLMSK